MTSQENLVPWLTSSQTKVNNTVKIAGFLAAGSTMAQAARSLKVSRPYLSKVAKTLVKQGILKRVGKYPILFFWANNKSQEMLTKTFGYSGSGVVNNQKTGSSLFIPHRFGAKYLFLRKPRAFKGFDTVVSPSKSWKAYKWFTHGFTVEAFPGCVKIWAKPPSFRGKKRDVLGHVKNGLVLLGERAKEFGGEQGCRLVFDKLYSPVEWVIEDLGLSEFVAQALDLRSGPVEIGGARFVLDETHDNVEINKDPATEKARRMEFLLGQGEELLLRVVELQHETMLRFERVVEDVEALKRGVRP